MKQLTIDDHSCLFQLGTQPSARISEDKRRSQFWCVWPSGVMDLSAIYNNRLVKIKLCFGINMIAFRATLGDTWASTWEFHLCRFPLIANYWFIIIHLYELSRLRALLSFWRPFSLRQSERRKSNSKQLKRNIVINISEPSQSSSSLKSTFLHLAIWYFSWIDRR